MRKRCFVSPNGPPVAGPYSPAVAAGNLLFVSGQIPLARDGSGIRRGTIEDETRQSLDNLKAVLEDAGSGLGQVVKVSAYLSDMNDFAAFNQVYKDYFPSDYPARICIQAGRLPLDSKVEVEAIAIVPEV